MRNWKACSVMAGCLLLAALAGGCAAPISKGGAGIQITPTGTVGVDLLGAAYDFDNAIRIGVLPPDDFGAACVHEVLKKTGLESDGDVAPESFIPKSEGVSVGAIAYIRAQQLRSLAGVEISRECKAFLGTLLVDGIHDTRSVGIRALLLK